MLGPHFIICTLARPATTAGCAVQRRRAPCAAWLGAVPGVATRRLLLASRISTWSPLMFDQRELSLGPRTRWQTTMTHRPTHSQTHAHPHTHSPGTNPRHADPLSSPVPHGAGRSLHPGGPREQQPAAAALAVCTCMKTCDPTPPHHHHHHHHVHSAHAWTDPSTISSRGVRTIHPSTSTPPSQNPSAQLTPPPPFNPNLKPTAACCSRRPWTCTPRRSPTA